MNIGSINPLVSPAASATDVGVEPVAPVDPFFQTTTVPSSPATQSPQSAPASNQIPAAPHGAMSIADALRRPVETNDAVRHAYRSSQAVAGDDERRQQEQRNKSPQQQAAQPETADASPIQSGTRGVADIYRF